MKTTRAGLSVVLPRDRCIAPHRVDMRGFDTPPRNPMKTAVALAAVAAACLVQPALAAEKAADASNSAITVAVLGDWPYNNLLLANANRLLDSVNGDAGVRAIIHVGDIHSGSQPCTSAGILPPIGTSNPGWNQAVFDVFQRFRAPVVYTPGDNEWTDCHKNKEGASGKPLNELAAVRGLFFSRPGVTLGLDEMEVVSQSQVSDPGSTDAKFVENVMWEDSHIVFVTLNVPGSNDDTVPWTGMFADSAAQMQERVERDAANGRWLDAAFALAQRHNAKAVVIALQADMWDPLALPAAGGDGLDGYTPFVRHLASDVLAYGRPVLLLNGDSHLYEADHPLADPTSATGVIHGTPAVPNLTRITVQGSTNAPAEWLRLTIDTSSKTAPFSFTNVPYCKDPLTSCQ
jgi:hypothetical protein